MKDDEEFKATHHSAIFAEASQYPSARFFMIMLLIPTDASVSTHEDAGTAAAEGDGVAHIVAMFSAITSEHKCPHRLVFQRWQRSLSSSPQSARQESRASTEV